MNVPMNLSKFGVLRFETGKPQSFFGGRPEHYTMLNSDQAMRMVGFVRNTPEEAERLLNPWENYYEEEEEIQPEDVDLIPIFVDGEHRMDSRLIARALGIRHESFMETVVKYSATAKEFGILRFQTGEITGRGQPEKYAMLNYDQAAFIISAQLQ